MVTNVIGFESEINIVCQNRRSRKVLHRKLSHRWVPYRYHICRVRGSKFSTIYRLREGRNTECISSFVPIFLFMWGRVYTKSIKDNIITKVIVLNFTFRYADGVLSISSSNFANFLCLICWHLSPTWHQMSHLFLTLL